MSATRELIAAARLDFGEVRGSRWLPVASLTFFIIAAVLVMVGARESSIIGFSGMHRVLLSFAHVLLVIIPLLALMATTQVVSRARDDGTIELLFSHPVSRRGYLSAVTLTRASVLLAPLLVLFAALAVVGRVAFSEAVPWGMVLRSASVSAALLWCFIGLGIAISATTRDQARAAVRGLVVWALAVALVDLALVGVLLQWRLPARAVFVLAALNPVQAARLALLSGLEPTLATLGPVGVYLSKELGSIGLSVLGIGWPAVLGTIAWFWGLGRFSRGDLV